MKRRHALQAIWQVVGRGMTGHRGSGIKAVKVRRCLISLFAVIFLKDVQSGRTLPVPAHLRDSHYPGAREFGHGEEYQYSHDFAGG